MWLFIHVGIKVNPCTQKWTLDFNLGSAKPSKMVYPGKIHYKNVFGGHIEWAVNCLPFELTHWGQVTHICLDNLAIIGSDNGLSPGQCQAITWINAGLLLIALLGTNFSDILIEIQTFLFNKVHFKCRLWNGIHFVSASMCPQNVFNHNL